MLLVCKVQELEDDGQQFLIRSQLVDLAQLVVLRHFSNLHVYVFVVSIAYSPEHSVDDIVDCIAHVHKLVVAFFVQVDASLVLTDASELLDGVNLD